MKTIRCPWFLAAILLLLLSFRSFAQGPPALPPNPLLQAFNYPTNFQGLFGGLPIAYTNVESVPFWRGNLALIGNTNSAPSYLRYRLIETNGNTNLLFSGGSIVFLFAPNWASADAVQLGSGPGEMAYFLSAGDWTTGAPNGFFGLSADPYGTNLVFWGMSNSIATAYVNTRISWSTNIFHAVDCEFTTSNSFLYVDGELAGSGAGVSVIPNTNVWTNGMFIGSDASGYEQARGAFCHTEIWSLQFGGFYSADGWNTISNSIYAWQGTSGGMSFGMMSGLDGGTLTGNGYTSDTSYNTNFSQYTNFWLNIGTADNGTQLVVSIISSLSNLTYQIVTNSTLDTNLADWGGWQTLTASNSVTVAPPVNIGTNALFFDAFMLWSTTTNGLPDWWQMKYFGNLHQPTNADYDGDGVKDWQEYANGTDPNKITFQISFTNQYVNLTNVPLSLGLQGGVPSCYAVLLDSTNFPSASWTSYTSSNITAHLGTNQGWHTVWVGLRGLPADAQQTWNAVGLDLDTVPPTLVVTNATNVTVPMLQLQGYASEELANLTFDLTNANGTISNQTGFMTGAIFDTNRFLYTNAAFKCFDLVFASGVNKVTLHAADLAGNLTTTNFTFHLDYSSKPPPVLQLYWPQNGAQISANSFTWRGAVDDPAVALSAQFTDTNGNTNIVAGVVERNGNFWVDNIPLATGTSNFTLTATDIHSNVTTTNITVVQSSVQITINPITSDLNAATATVTGTISATNYTVWVNGVKATTNAPPISWTATNVPINGAGSAVIQARAIPNTDNSGNGTTNGGGGTNSSLSNPGNPPAPDAVDQEMNQDKAPALVCDNYHASWTWLGADSGGTDTLASTTDWSAATGGSSQLTYSTGSEYGNTQSQWDTNGNGTTQSEYIENFGWWIYTNITGPSPLHGGATFFDGRQGQSHGWETGAPGLGSGETGTGAESASIRYTLRTGGRSVPGRQSLWRLSAGPQQIVDPWYPDGSYALWNPYWLSGTILTNTPYQEVTIMGEPEDSDGGVFVVLPDGDAVDATPKATSVAYYSFDLTTNEYKPQIYFGGTNVTHSNVTVVAGQQINLSISGAPSGSSFSWSVPGYAISNYDIVNGILYTNFRLTNSTAIFYWVDGGSKTVSCSTGSGLATLSTTVTFTVLRPTITFTDNPPSWATNDTIAGTLSLSLGDNAGKGMMDYTVAITSPCDGRADFTQLINKSAANGNTSDTTSGQYWLDNYSFYIAQTNNPNSTAVLAVPANRSLPLWAFEDGPCYALAHSIFSSTTSIYEQFKDYIMFRPANGNATNNIYVPLGKTTWSWSSYSVWSGAAWSSPTPNTTVIRPPTPDAGFEFPTWNNIEHNK